MTRLADVVSDRDALDEAEAEPEEDTDAVGSDADDIRTRSVMAEKSCIVSPGLYNLAHAQPAAASGF
ncbi:hypothetical protein [Pandoraea morbifera]|uniref:hypothetical protein n=1 Tax=Pandoraea morbifera TaxID=2508300 RepID=UPI001FE6586C|nr:hypothetical protein [Pandoraea morbifera]